MRRLFTHILPILGLIVVLASCGGNTGSGGDRPDTITLAPCPTFCADSAFIHIQTQCDFGSRVTGSEAAQECGDWIAEQFRLYGATVTEQEVEATLYDGTKLKGRNIVASINPENRDRILFCAHWDCRPWADNDPDERNHRKPILAANDAASGVAVMLELARLLQSSPVKTGIDFVCFDAEDLGTPTWADTDGSDVPGYTGGWCQGSEQWATQAANSGYAARFGVLLDMVGGRGAKFRREAISLQYAQPVVDMIWHLGMQIGYSQYFPLKQGGSIIDDHQNVNMIARVPCLDIIPYYEDGPSSFGPTWHTVEDTPENIDPAVLEAVGQTLTQLIYNDNAE